MRTAIQTDGAPAAIGPYSQAVRAGQLLFVSGQIPLEPDTGELVEGGIVDQTHRVMRSLGAILEAAGVSFDAVLRTTVYLTDLGEFAAMNDVYASYFTDPTPARATVQIAGLPKGARVEIDVIATLPS
jgi:2-iminobutanoate/2-iminopropanoate deaminase